MFRDSKQQRDITFAVHVVPRASKSEIIGQHDGALKVRIAASPVEGAANAELVRLLAKFLELPQNAIEIISGATSRRKVVRAHGANAEQLERLIATKNRTPDGTAINFSLSDH
jgi:uncharacterized protein